MPAKIYNIVWDVGPDFQRVLYLRPGPDSDISGYTGKMQVRPSAISDTVIVELSTENGRMTLGNGSVTLNVANTVSIDTSSCTRSGALTEELPSGEIVEGCGPLAVFDLVVTSPSNVEYPLLRGQVCLVRTVTR